MRFIVSVPVLSEQIIPTDPSDSTASKFLTRQFFFAIRLAVNAKQTVKHAIRPSGTFAITTPIKKTNESTILYPKPIEIIKKVIPKPNATIVTM